MKREQNISMLYGVVLAFLLSFGGIGAMVTALDLQVGSMWRMALLCLAVALVTALLLRLKWGGGMILVLFVAINIALWRGEAAAEQTSAMLYKISTFYNGAYGWGVFPGKAYYSPEGVMDIPLGLIGALVAVNTAWTVCHRTGALDCVLLAILPVAACVVVTDTVPDTIYLYLWLYGLGMLILTNGVRKRNRGQGNTLTAMAAIPVALVLGLLFWLNPREGYDKHPAQLRETVGEILQELPDLWEDVSDDIASAVDGSVRVTEVDLEDLGPRLKRVYPVMDVISPVSGAVYLRGQDYDTYTGAGWTSARHRTEPFPREPFDSVAGELTIRTRRVRDVLYLPYYISDPVTLAGGCLNNTENRREYSFVMSLLPENWRERVEAEEMTRDEGIHFTNAGLSGGEDPQRWSRLPDSTAVWAKSVLEQILPERGSVTAIADAVGNYVRGSALYDLDTPQMPDGEEDFARWFLEDGETGYCVHFATAATVLLRAAGVQARYVEGYMFEAVAGQEVTVTADQAHAWAEYYEPVLDTWIVLEATPADLNGEEETAPVPETTEQTPEESTEAITEVTRPDRPEEDTRPTGVSDAGETDGSGSSQRDTGVWKAILWILLGAMTAALLVLQRQLRLAHNRKMRRRGNANARALYRWRELAKCCRILKQPPPEAAEAVAQKAKYSNHSVTAEELRLLDEHLRQAEARLRQRPWYLKIIDQYFFAVY